MARSWRVDIKAALGLQLADTETCEWMWGDVGKGATGIHELARFNPARWSSTKSLEGTITELCRVRENDRRRPVVLKIPAGVLSRERPFGDVQEAISALERIVVAGTDAEASSATVRSVASGNSNDVGLVAVEVQVGSAKQNTKAFLADGPEVRETVFLPAPAQGEGMVVRLWRVGNFQRALVGEAEVAEAAGVETEGPVTRDGRVRGFVRLSVASVETVSVQEPARPDRFGQRVMQLPNRLSGLEPAGMNLLARRPLLSRAADAPAIGECLVTIRSVSGLSPKLREPYFVLSLEGQEQCAERFAQATESELTYKFGICSLQSSLRVYCYDDLGVDRDAVAGRILIPLSDIFWTAGAAPSLSRICSAVYPPEAATKDYTAQFMPCGRGRDGRGSRSFVDRFEPAVETQSKSGMARAQVFGCVRLRIEVSLALTARSPVRSYAGSLSAGVRKAVFHSKVHPAECSPQKTQAEMSVLDLLKSLDLDRIERAVKRIEAFLSAPSQGLVRWFRTSYWHGLAAGAAWCAICWLRFCPDWSWPLYAWLALLVNGWLVARQREHVWAIDAGLAFPVWNEDVVPETLEEGIASFKRDMENIRRCTKALTSFLERCSNAFDFSDGAATVLCLTGTLLAALLLSLTWFLWDWVDPSGRVSRPCTGLVICVALSCSKPTPTNESQATEEDPMEQVSAFNRIFDFIPDQAEVAHRYIATRVQCQPEEAQGSVANTSETP